MLDLPLVYARHRGDVAIRGGLFAASVGGVAPRAREIARDCFVPVDED